MWGLGQNQISTEEISMVRNKKLAYMKQTGNSDGMRGARLLFWILYFTQTSISEEECLM